MTLLRKVLFAVACALLAGYATHELEWTLAPVEPIAPLNEAPASAPTEAGAAGKPSAGKTRDSKGEAANKAEDDKKAEAAKKADEARKSEADKKAESDNKNEADRKADAEKKAEADTKANETETSDDKKAEAENKNEEAKKTDEAARVGTLVVGSWSGAYADSQKVAFFDPFTKDGGLKVEQAVHDGEIATISEKIGGWDVADLDRRALDRLCEDGTLRKLDSADLSDGPRGVKAADDFVGGGIEPCGIANIVWSSVVAFNEAAFEKNAPRRLADLLDTKRFPGKRALPEGPEYTLEIALLADGVKPADIYRMLESDDGVKRALAVLDRIRNDIVWWKSAREPLRMLANDDVAMALAFNGRVFTASVVEKQTLGRIWGGAIWDFDYWAIPKEASNPDQALRFVKFATEPERMAEQSRWFPYAPARKSAADMVGKHAEVDVDMRDFAPTAGERLDNGLRFDALWWAKNRERLAAKLEAWRKPPEPTPVAREEKPSEPAKPDDKAAQQEPAKKEEKPAPTAAENEDKKDGAAASPKDDPMAADKPEDKDKSAADKPDAKDKPAPELAAKKAESGGTDKKAQ